MAIDFLKIIQRTEISNIANILITKATKINFLVFLGIFSPKEFPTKAHRLYATEKETIQIQFHKLNKKTFAYKILFPNRPTIRFKPKKDQF